MAALRSLVIVPLGSCSCTALLHALHVGRYMTASLRLENRSCVVLPSPIHGLVALDENALLSGMFLSVKNIVSEITPSPNGLSSHFQLIHFQSIPLSSDDEYAF